MNKTKSILVSLAAIAVIGGGGIWFYDSSQGAQESTENSQAITQVQVAEKKPEITISEDEKTVSYQGQAGSTALEILKSGLDVTVEDSSFGEFVTGINGVEADSSKEYWSFYVDGDYAPEGAGTYQTTDGEQIEWKLEQL